jgi:hypothetical protein
MNTSKSSFLHPLQRFLLQMTLSSVEVLDPFNDGGNRIKTRGLLETSYSSAFFVFNYINFIFEQLEKNCGKMIG